MPCFSCTKIHDRAEQKLFWRGPKISGERVLWYVLLSPYVLHPPISWPKSVTQKHCFRIICVIILGIMVKWTACSPTVVSKLITDTHVLWGKLISSYRCRIVLPEELIAITATDLWESLQKTSHYRYRFSLEF